MSERHLTLNISQRSQIIEDTVEPSLPAWEINLKACAPVIRTQNLPVDPGIEPRLLRQIVPVGAHCVSANWATEAGYQPYSFLTCLLVQFLKLTLLTKRSSSATTSSALR